MSRKGPELVFPTLKMTTELEEVKEKVKIQTVDKDLSLEGENFLMRLSGYLLAIGASKRQIADALGISTRWFAKKYRDHPKVIKYQEEYEQKLAVELEADFGRVVKEVKSLAYAKVADVKAGDKLGALRLLGDFYNKMPAKKIELTGAGGGPIGVEAYKRLTPEELKTRIAERTRQVEGVE